MLSTETGHIRDYSRSPYQGYEEVPDLMLPVDHQSPWYGNKERVIGITLNGKHKAYPFAELEKAKGPVIDTFQAKKLTITFDKKSQTARILTKSRKIFLLSPFFGLPGNTFHPDTEVFKE